MAGLRAFIDKVIYFLLDGYCAVITPTNTVSTKYLTQQKLLTIHQSECYDVQEIRHHVWLNIKPDFTFGLLLKCQYDNLTDSMFENGQN